MKSRLIMEYIYSMYYNCVSANVYVNRNGKIVSERYLEENAGPIWLDDITCSGKEFNILQCSKGEWGQHDCSHQEDISINCYQDNDSHKALLGKLPFILFVYSSAHLTRKELFFTWTSGSKIFRDVWEERLKN